MIHDVDATLRAIIERDVLNGPGVELSFDAPTKEWAAKLSLPTINVFLYDIREDPTRTRRVLRGGAQRGRQGRRATSTAAAYAARVSAVGVDEAGRGRAPLAVRPARLLHTRRRAPTGSARRLACRRRPPGDHPDRDLVRGRRPVLGGVGCPRWRAPAVDPPGRHRAVRRVADAPRRAPGHGDAAHHRRAPRRRHRSTDRGAVADARRIQRRRRPRRSPLCPTRSCGPVPRTNRGGCSASGRCRNADDRECTMSDAGGLRMRDARPVGGPRGSGAGGCRERSARRTDDGRRAHAGWW